MTELAPSFRNSAQMPAPEGIIEKLRKGRPVTDTEATVFFDWILHDTALILMKSLREIHSSAGKESQSIDFALHPFTDMCSFSQNIVSYGLEDCGLKPKTFSTFCLPNYAVGHAVTTQEILTTSGPQLYVCEPTFSQMYDPEMPAYDDNLLAGFVLEKQAGGMNIVHEFLQRGYMRMTPDTAHQYLSALCCGIPPFATASQSMEFLRNPVDDNAHAYFKKEIMAAGDYLIRTSTPKME